MRLNKYIILVILMLFMNTSYIFGVEQSVVQGPVEPEPEVEWILGEVTSVDIPNKRIIVKYFDYDNDIEKEITITVSEQTTYNEINSIGQLKPQDTVSVDYITDRQGLNLAKNISLEKEEETPGLTPKLNATEETQPTESGTEEIPPSPEEKSY